MKSYFCQDEYGQIAPGMPRERIIVVTLSGRGDKDCAAMARYRGHDVGE